MLPSARGMETTALLLHKDEYSWVVKTIKKDHRGSAQAPIQLKATIYSVHI